MRDAGGERELARSKGLGGSGDVDLRTFVRYGVEEEEGTDDCATI